MTVVVLADGFEEIEAVTPIDLLRRAGETVIVAGLSERSAVGARGVRIACDALLSETANDWDALVLPGGMGGARNLAASTAVGAAIKTTLERGAWLGAICASPSVVLGAFGVLEGRRYTGYPGLAAVAGATYLTEAIVVDGLVITSRGVGTASEFSLKLVELLRGPEARAEVARATLLIGSAD